MPEKIEPVTTTDAKTLRDKFEKIGEQIRKSVVDFTTLSVTTISGDVEHIIKTDSDKKSRFDVQDIVSKLNAKGKTKSKIYVIAHTHIDFDHDTVNFVKADLSTEEAALFDLHQGAIESAYIARRSFLHFLKEVIN